MKNKFWETIEKFTNHWNRNSDDSLTLWFSGYKPQEMYDCEEAMNKEHGFACLNEEFDKVCGKTALRIIKKDAQYQVLVIEKKGMVILEMYKGLSEKQAKTKFKKVVDKYDSKYVKQLLKRGEIVSNIAC